MPDKHKPLSDGALDEMLRYYHYDSLEYRAASELRELRAAADEMLQVANGHYVGYFAEPLRALAKARGKGE